MRGKPTGFWGKLKKSDDGEIVAWHSVVDHCADVAACCEAILKCSLVRKRLAALAGLTDLTRMQIARLCVIAALHDLGKFNRGFQNKALINPPFTCGHVCEAAAPLFSHDTHAERQKLIEALGLVEMVDWGGESEESVSQLLVAAISHHGKPVDVEKQIHRDAWKATPDSDPFAGVRELAAKARAWFPEAFEPGGEVLPDVPAFVHGFSGLVMLADWLGSDAREEFFSYDDEGGYERMPHARTRAAKAVRMIGLDPDLSRRSFRGRVPEFDRISKYSPRPQQRALADVPISERGSVVVLEAETGSGKTEAALVHYLRLLQAGLVDGMYFALPTRTAATQIQRRVTRALRRAFRRRDSRPVTVLAVPGYIVADDATATRLPKFQVLWNDDDAERYRYRRWAAEQPKRYLAGAVAVGTIDQALLSALTVGHAHMRATALLRSLLVVDEVHASDAYMTAILEQVLRRHVAAGGHVLLMSATLGSSARHRLLAACGDVSPALGLDDAIAVPYPIVTRYAPGGRQEPILPVLTDDERRDAEDKRVQVELAPTISDPEAIAGRALEFARDGARVIVLRNTVKGCVAVQQALERLAEESGDATLLFRCNRLPAPHHSRFSKADREALDTMLARQFGKRRPKGGLVVVATQTVQQSLDLDADVLITDLCPMDVLLQRIGRLHRHDRRGARPSKFEEPLAVILVPETRDLRASIQADGKVASVQGIGSVYDDLRIVEATWRQLEAAPGKTLAIPSMNRELVERATHSAALAKIVEGNGSSWEKHQERVTGEVQAERICAAMNVGRWDVPFDEAGFPSDDVGRRIATRLGEDDRRVVFAEPLPESPFGRPVRELAIPSWMATGIGEGEPRDIVRNAEGFEFTLGARRFRYDRFGLSTM